ncbi:MULTISPECIES: undecaprenyl-diphosphate phosphatase [Ferrimonas]|uniref:undecaprenyl-diphosphate phosphatase n=1 Tax=Ferrimonas TaxID=44011 RepID=UPI000427E701|nr:MULTISPECIES: undecaprenyl-diphosphate phosphatase [Ferrimonas]USD37034.1 undecaprenyl-diphosphate phosphatase [Ferrimonas sp. SCSIO 43195]
MDLIQAFWLALIQGVTEFLPISSSAHLILPSQVLGWPDQGLAFDAIINLGTWVAVVIYFREDVSKLLMAWLRSLTGQHSEYSRLAWLIILGTIPVGLAGILFNDFISTELRASWVLASTTLVFGLLLWWADSKPSEKREIADITWQIVLVIGLAQALALIPGTSRSGATITAALFLGLSRMAAARFSFLLAIPVGALAGGYEALGLVSNPEPVDWTSLSAALVVAFISAYLCIHFFLKIISRMGMLPFVIYRLALAGVLFAFFV